MRIIWNLSLIFTGIIELFLFPPLLLINFVLYFMFKPKPEPQSPTVVVIKEGKD